MVFISSCIVFGTRCGYIDTHRGGLSNIIAKQGFGFNISSQLSIEGVIMSQMYMNNVCLWHYENNKVSDYLP